MNKNIQTNYNFVSFRWANFSAASKTYKTKRCLNIFFFNDTIKVRILWNRLSQIRGDFNKFPDFFLYRPVKLL